MRGAPRAIRYRPVGCAPSCLCPREERPSAAASWLTLDAADTRDTRIARATAGSLANVYAAGLAHLPVRSEARPTSDATAARGSSRTRSAPSIRAHRSSFRPIGEEASDSTVTGACSLRLGRTRVSGSMVNSMMSGALWSPATARGRRAVPTTPKRTPFWTSSLLLDTSNLPIGCVLPLA